MADRKRLSDILLNSERERLERAWSTTTAAADLKPIPPGEYRCALAGKDFFTSRYGKPGVKFVLEVLDGEHAGRRLWLDIYLTPEALPMAKRDLCKLGIESLEQLERPLPPGIIVSAKVTLRRGDDGAEFNRIARFDLVGVEKPEPDPFAPSEGTDTDGFDWRTGEQTGGPES